MTEVPAPDLPSPALITATLGAFEKTAALRAAIELDFFTAIAEGADTAEALAEHCAAVVRGTRILADSLTVLGFLQKRNGTYKLTRDSEAFLDRKSPTYLGNLVKFAASAEKVHRYLDDPAGWVQRGGPDDLANVAPDNPIWVDFAVGMMPLVQPIACRVAEMVWESGARPRHVLDIAAGHGLYGIEIARRNFTANIVALDWAPVLTVARKNAAAAKIDDRYATIVGDAFSANLGESYDLALVPNFLHHFSKSACATLLRRIRAALITGGRLAIVEYVPNEDRVSPPFASLFALTMLTGTPEGDAYTAKDLEHICRDAGFVSITFQAVALTSQTLVLADAP